jgi:hypothetical protein
MSSEVLGAPKLGLFYDPLALPRLQTRREHDIYELRVKFAFPSRTQIPKKTCFNQKTNKVEGNILILL